MPFFELSLGSLVGTITRAGEAAWNRLRGRKGQLTPSDVVKSRAKWKPEFSHEIAQRRNKRLRFDVIVRDVARLDGYPKIDKTAKGISPWFRVGLVDTYSEGIRLVLGWYELVPSAVGGYRRKGYKGESEELPSFDAALIGFVPYEQIVHVDWDGDEYYGFPVIYCHFDASRRTPYRRRAYCICRTLEHSNGDQELWHEIADADEVHKSSRNAGIAF
jgi:hypothetical protein